MVNNPSPMEQQMSTSIVVAYPFSPAELAEYVEQFRGMTFSNPSNYKIGVKGIADLRDRRLKIEERRKLLKQDSLEYGRKVDAVAKDLTAIIESVENSLKAAKLEVDNAKAAAKREAEAAERAAVEAEIRAKREAEEHELAVRRQADEERIRQERAQLEADRFAAAAERAQLEQERAEAHAEREKARAELAELRAEQTKRAAEKAERARLEQEAAEAEQARVMALEHAAALKAREEALAPDIVRIHAFAVTVDSWIDLVPKGRTNEGAAFLVDVVRATIEDLAEQCRTVKL